MSDAFLFNVLPYAAAGVALAGTIWRVTSREPPPPTTPWTSAGRAVLAGVAIVAFFHLLGLAAPRAMQAFNASPARLFTLESLQLIGAMLLAWGLASLGLRRVKAGQWTPALTLGLLFAHVLTAVYIAVALRWGTAWYLHIGVPYVRSLMTFQPDATRMLTAPTVYQVHVLLGFVLLALAPFIRMNRAPVPQRAEESVEPGLLGTPREETP